MSEGIRAPCFGLGLQSEQGVTERINARAHDTARPCQRSTPAARRPAALSLLSVAAVPLLPVGAEGEEEKDCESVSGRPCRCRLSISTSRALSIIRTFAASFRTSDIRCEHEIRCARSSSSSQMRRACRTRRASRRAGSSAREAQADSSFATARRMSAV
jgi:hypothetical protein